MSSHLWGGLIMGGLALLIGASWIAGALRRQRSHAGGSPTYDATGGVVYTVFQIGCAGLLMVGGVAILVLMLLGGYAGRG